MNCEEFVDGIVYKKSYFATGVIENLIRPPGRKPHERDVKLSEFYNSLNDEQKKRVNDIVYESTESAIFHLLCILDHVSFLEETEEKTQFELYAVKGKERVLINDPSKENLHDMYNSLAMDA